MFMVFRFFNLNRQDVIYEALQGFSPSSARNFFRLYQCGR